MHYCLELCKYGDRGNEGSLCSLLNEAVRFSFGNSLLESQWPNGLRFISLIGSQVDT